MYKTTEKKKKKKKEEKEKRIKEAKSMFLIIMHNPRDRYQWQIRFRRCPYCSEIVSGMGPTVPQSDSSTGLGYPSIQYVTTRREIQILFPIPS